MPVTVLYIFVVLLVLIGLCYIVLKRKSNTLTVLVYQKIGDPPKHCSNHKEWTSVAALTARLDRLQNHAFSTVSVEQIRQGNLPSKSVFDGIYTFSATNPFPKIIIPLYSICSFKLSLNIKP